MKTIVVLTRREGASSEDFVRLSKAELVAVWNGMAAGGLRAVDGVTEGASAVLEMETHTLDEAKRFV